MSRRVDPELLDELAFDDPEALRSRRDLRLVNALMGNWRWMRKALDQCAADRVVELGAGDGGFLRTAGAAGRELVGLDLAPRPDDLPAGIEWVQGDAAEVLAGAVRNGTVAISNHLLHQFQDEELRQLGEALRDCRAIVACEPLRAWRTRVQGVSIWPLLNRVTRYDMLVSIRAGFRRGELPVLLGLDERDWHLHERGTMRGAYRMIARKREDPERRK